MGQRWPERGPPVRAWLGAAIDALCGELGSNLIGAYLHGSLAGGSFYPPKSDVDLLFVVTDPLPPEARRCFAERCVHVSRNRPIVGGLECSLMLAESADRPIHPIPFEVHFADEWVADIQSGAVDYAAPRTDPDLAAHCQATLEIGICLRGRPAHEVFGPVSKSDFMESVLGDLQWILDSRQSLEQPLLRCLELLSSPLALERPFAPLGTVQGRGRLEGDRPIAAGSARCRRGSARSLSRRYPSTGQTPQNGGTPLG